MWWIGFLVLLALLIPLAFILLDSEVGRALARRLGSEPRSPDDPRIDSLEKEVHYLSETVQSLQEETRFIRNLLEQPRRGEPNPSGEG